MCLAVFRLAQSWSIDVKLEYVIVGIKKQIQPISIDRSLGSINQNSRLNIFFAEFQLSPILIKMFWVF